MVTTATENCDKLDNAATSKVQYLSWVSVMGAVIKSLDIQRFGFYCRMNWIQLGLGLNSADVAVIAEELGKYFNQSVYTIRI